MFSIVWKNQRQVEAQIKEDKKNAKKAEKTIPERLGQLMVKEAKKRVPVLTGKLKRNIYMRSTSKGVQVIADTDYADLVEFGGTRNKSKPFMRPAFEAAERQLDTIVDEEMKIK